MPAYDAGLDGYDSRRGSRAAGRAVAGPFRLVLRLNGVAESWSVWLLLVHAATAGFMAAAHALSAPTLSGARRRPCQVSIAPFVVFNPRPGTPRAVGSSCSTISCGPEAAYREGDVSLASAEGFIRQVLGWREFMRHVYDERRSLYAETNALEARLPLPSWYWGQPSGGVCATKPYVSSGKHVQRMGPSVCAGCQFDAATTTGETACPLNHLYWDFLERQSDRLRANVRMAIPLAALKRLAPAVMDDHRAHAALWRDRALDAGLAALTARQQPERG